MGKTLRMLFMAFFRASNFTFGGGPAMVPMIKYEAVTNLKWLTEEEYADILAIANALPAPLATKLSAMVGYRVAGWPGVLIAETAAIMPTALVMVFLGSLIMTFADTPALQAMLAGVRPVVVVLVLQAALDMGKTAFVDSATWVFGAIALVIFLFASWLHPSFLVVLSLFMGYLLFRKQMAKQIAK